MFSHRPLIPELVFTRVTRSVSPELSAHHLASFTFLAPSPRHLKLMVTTHHQGNIRYTYIIFNTIFLSVVTVCDRWNFGSGSHFICNRKTVTFLFYVIKNISLQPYHLAVNPAPSLQSRFYNWVWPCLTGAVSPWLPDGGTWMDGGCSWTQITGNIQWQLNFASTGADVKCIFIL